MATMATLTMPLSSERADSTIRSSVNSSGRSATQSLGPFHEVLIADPPADERQPFELADGLRELLGEVLDLGDRPRGEDGDDDEGDAGDCRGDTDDGDTTTDVETADDGVDDRIERKSDEHSDADSRQHQRRVADDGENSEHDEHGRDHGEERRTVEPESWSASRAAGDGSTPAATHPRRQRCSRSDDAMRPAGGCGCPPSTTARGGRYYRAFMARAQRRAKRRVSDAPAGAAPRLGARLVRFTPGAALLVTAAVVVAFLLRNAFVAAHQIVGWVVACALVALLIDPVVNLVQRVLPRAVSVVVVVVTMIAVVAVILVGLTRELLASLDDLERGGTRGGARARGPL